MKNTGFTLVELTIIVAIVGVLAMISVPIYERYVASTQVSRALGELAAYKAPFEERVSASGGVSNGYIGYAPSDLTTGSLAVDIGVLNLDGSGQLQVTMGGRAHQSLEGLILRFERSSTGVWECFLDVGGVSVWRASYLPPGCGY